MKDFEDYFQVVAREIPWKCKSYPVTTLCREPTSAFVICSPVYPTSPKSLPSLLFPLLHHTKPLVSRTWSQDMAFVFAIYLCLKHYLTSPKPSPEIRRPPSFISLWFWLPCHLSVSSFLVTQLKSSPPSFFPALFSSIASTSDGALSNH